MVRSDWWGEFHNSSHLHMSYLQPSAALPFLVFNSSSVCYSKTYRARCIVQTRVHFDLSSSSHYVLARFATNLFTLHPTRLIRNVEPQPTSIPGISMLLGPPVCSSDNALVCVGPAILTRRPSSTLREQASGPHLQGSLYACSSLQTISRLCEHSPPVLVSAADRGWIYQPADI